MNLRLPAQFKCSNVHSLLPQSHRRFLRASNSEFSEISPSEFNLTPFSQ